VIVTGVESCWEMSGSQASICGYSSHASKAALFTLCWLGCNADFGVNHDRYPPATRLIFAVGRMKHGLEEAVLGEAPRALSVVRATLLSGPCHRTAPADRYELETDRGNKHRVFTSCDLARIASVVPAADLACASRIENSRAESRIRQRCAAPDVCPTLTRR